MKTRRICAGYRDALAVECATRWLTSGQPLRALSELRQISDPARNDPGLRKLIALASDAAREEIEPALPIEFPG